MEKHGRINITQQIPFILETKRISQRGCPTGVGIHF